MVWSHSSESPYWDTVKPDETIVGGDNFDDLKSDKKIIAALKWLKVN